MAALRCNRPIPGILMCYVQLPQIATWLINDWNPTCKYVRLNIVISHSSTYSKFQSSKPNHGFLPKTQTEPILRFWGETESNVKNQFCRPLVPRKLALLWLWDAFIIRFWHTQQARLIQTLDKPLASGRIQTDNLAFIWKSCHGTKTVKHTERQTNARKSKNVSYAVM